jgi:hypothetical protein
MKHEKFYEDAARASENNKVAIAYSSMCGCYYCNRTFKASDVKDYVGRRDRALCPLCGIDSVVPDETMPEATDVEWLAKQYEYWFNTFS